MVESAATERLTNRRSPLKIRSIDRPTRLQEMTHGEKSVSDHTRLATATTLGDRDYENLDNTTLSRHEASGYQPSNFQRSAAVIHNYYEVASNGCVSLWKPHENRWALGNNDYVEPDATILPLQEAPGYQSLQIQESNDETYADYDVVGV